MRVNGNEAECLFVEDERHPDVHTAVTASHCVRLPAPETKETILMKYASPHWNAIKSASNPMMKHEYRKETQEEMKSERISPQKKKVIKISPLPCTSPYLLQLREHQSCTQQLLHKCCGMQPLGMEECPAPARRAFPQSPAVPGWLQALGRACLSCTDHSKRMWVSVPWRPTARNRA